MKSKSCFCFLVLGFLLIPARPSLGDGYGFYSWGRGWPKVGVPDFIKDQLPGLPDVEFELQLDHYTLGYLYDSAPGRDQWISYRFNLGVDIAVASLGSVDLGSAPVSALTGYTKLISDSFDAVGYGLMTKFTVGFGLVRSERLRLWVGPSVRLAGNYLDQQATTVEINSFPFEINPWAVSLSAGGGLEGGVNYRFGPELTVDLSVGFHYNVFACYQDVGLRVGSQPVAEDSSFLLGREPYVYVQLALRFGFLDTGNGR